MAVTAVVGAGAAAVLLPSTAQDDIPARGSVILINGDGMAAAQRLAARLDQVGADGQPAMDRFPVSGVQTTDPRDPGDTVTDSAAAATAWATGETTYNGAISVDVDRRPLTPLGAEAEAAGLATGLVTTAQVTDASPAAFFSSVTDRGQQSEIARQYVEATHPDVVLGGGEDHWLPAGNEGAFPPRGEEADPEISSAPTDLVAEARGQGYQYVTNADELAMADGDRLLGLFANEEMFQQRPEGAGDTFDPVVPLAEMTDKALEVLGRQKGGFFLFVEEEAVDEMAHANNGTRVLEALRELDRTVQVAHRYAAAHPDTLLIVTGDHECGGLSVRVPEDTAEAASSGEDGPFTVAGSDQEFYLDWTTTGHTGAPTPVTAEGPRSEELSGTYPNTHLHQVMRELLLG